MNKKWMPITAGVLDIAYGAFGVLFGPYAFIFTYFISVSFHGTYRAAIMGPMAFIAGILSLIGGIYHIKIKHWSLALIGSICTLLITWVFLSALTQLQLHLKI
jgi:Zn-dependent protease